MRVIAFMNQKGGVGKTTTTVNLGAAIAELGKKVCLIDLDPQAHLTINYGIEPSDEICSLYSVLVEGKSFLEAVHKATDNIAIVPSSIDLAAAEIELVSVLGREMLLKKKIEAATHDFDFILLDCPPSLGLLTINALAVASEVIIPMQPHFLALQGVAKLLETVQLVNKRMNPSLKVAGIVLTMFDAQTKLTTEVVAELQRFIEEAKGKPLPWADARIFKNKIRRNIKLAESPSFGQTILDYDSASNGAADYRALAREIVGIPEPVEPPLQPQVTVSVIPPLDRPVVLNLTPSLPDKPKAKSPARPTPHSSPSPGTLSPEVGKGRGEGPPSSHSKPARISPKHAPSAAPSSTAPEPKPAPPVTVSINPAITPIKPPAPNKHSSEAVA